MSTSPPPTRIRRARRVRACARVGAVAALMLASLGWASAPATAATAFDPSACTGSALQLPFDTGTGSITPSDCTIAFGSTSSSAQLRIQQRDAFGSAMYSPGGSAPDPAFDGDPSMPCFPCGGVLRFSGSVDDTLSVAGQDDGKVVLAASGGANFILVHRLTSTGALDTTFDGPSGGGNGAVGLNPPTTGGQAAVHGLRQLSDGRIVLTGYTMYGGAPEDAFVIRLRADGSFDPTFNGDGYVQLDFSSLPDATGSYLDFAPGMDIADDGSVFVAGCIDEQDPMDWCSAGPRWAFVAKVGAGGSLDPKFNGDGIWIGRPTGAVGDAFQDIAVQADGKPVAVGRSGGNDILVARFTQDGNLDTTYNATGFRTTNAGGFDRGYGVDIDAQGRAVVGGAGNISGTVAYAAVRLTSTGLLDE